MWPWRDIRYMGPRQSTHWCHKEAGMGASLKLGQPLPGQACHLGPGPHLKDSRCDLLPPSSLRRRWA